MAESWLREGRSGEAILTLHVQPNARATEFVGLHGEALKLRLAAPPVDGKANAALCAYLADFCGVGRQAVEVLSGAGARSKRVAVRGLDAQAWQRLQALACRDA